MGTIGRASGLDSDDGSGKLQYGTLTSPVINAKGPVCLSVTWLSTTGVSVSIRFNRTYSALILERGHGLSEKWTDNHFSLARDFVEKGPSFQIHIEAKTATSGSKIALAVNELNVLRGSCREKCKSKCIKLFYYYYLLPI